MAEERRSQRSGWTPPSWRTSFCLGFAGASLLLVFFPLPCFFLFNIITWGFPKCLQFPWYKLGLLTSFLPSFPNRIISLRIRANFLLH